MFECENTSQIIKYYCKHLHQESTIKQKYPYPRDFHVKVCITVCYFYIVGICNINLPHWVQTFYLYTVIQEIVSKLVDTIDIKFEILPQQEFGQESPIFDQKVGQTHRKPPMNGEAEYEGKQCCEGAHRQKQQSGRLISCSLPRFTVRRGHK